MSVHTSKMTFKLIKKGSNVDAFLNWAKDYILTSSFDEKIMASLTSARRNSNLQKAVRELIDAIIYDAYQPYDYKRTYNLKKSFKVAPGVPGEPDSIGVTVFSDIDVATATSGDAAGQFSYAAFFEGPVTWNSFIKDYEDDPIGVVRYRPFMEETTRLVQQENELSAIHALKVAIKKRMPGQVRT